MAEDAKASASRDGWAKVFTDLVLSGTWAELTDAEKALAPCIYVNANNKTHRTWWGKVELAAMSKLSIRAVQVAFKRLADRGLISREWDGNHRHAAVTTIKPVTKARLDWKAVARAHRDALLTSEPPCSSAPPRATLANGDAPPSAPAGDSVAHDGAPQPNNTTIDDNHRNNQSPAAPVTATSSTSSRKKSSTKAQANSPAVEGIYQAYPRQTARADALRAIVKALDVIRKRPGVADPEVWLLSKVQQYAEARQRVVAADPGEKQYTPYPATWFNKGRFDDDPAQWEPSRRNHGSNAKQREFAEPESDLPIFDFKSGGGASHSAVGGTNPQVGGGTCEGNGGAGSTAA